MSDKKPAKGEIGYTTEMVVKRGPDGQIIKVVYAKKRLQPTKLHPTKGDPRVCFDEDDREADPL